MSIAFYINLLLSLSFLLVTVLVLKKSHNIANIAFSWTTALFSLSTFFGLVEELYTDQIIPGSIPALITILDNVIFPLAPLGLVFSSFIIKNGYSSWKNLTLWIFTILYVIIENTLFFLSFTKDYSVLNEIMNLTIWNALLIIPLMISVIIFFSIYREMNEEKSKMLIVVIGVATGTLGQVLNSIGIFISNDDLVLISYIVIVIGVLVVSLSFMNITSSSQTRSIAPSPN